MTKLNEKELRDLFQELKDGNKNSAIEKLYCKYEKMVYGVAFSILKKKEEAEEIVQTVFLKLYTIDKSKLPTSKESSWLYRVTKNETISSLRKKKCNVNLDDLYHISDNDNYIKEIIDKDKYNRLLRKLDEEEQEIIALKIISNLSFAQIGKMLNKSSNTIKWKYYKAIKTLKILITNLTISSLAFLLLVKEYKKNNNIIVEKKEENLITENGNTLGGQQNVETHESTDYSCIQYIYNASIFTIFTFSSIFMVIFTFFFIKYQLKLKKKRLNKRQRN